MTDETKRGAKKSNKIKIRLKSSIFGRILISFASALRFLKRKSNLSLRYFSDSKNIHGFNHSISGYVMILIVMAVPVLLFGAKYLLDHRTLLNRQATLGSGERQVKECAEDAALEVSKKWNPALTYAQQKTAMLRIADNVYNDSPTYVGTLINQAVGRVDVTKEVTSKGGMYDPVKVTESVESSKTDLGKEKKQVAQETKTTDMKRYHFYYYYKTNHAPMAVKHFDIMYASLKRSNANLFPPDEDLYQDYVYYCENTTDPLGKEVGWYHYVTWPEVVGMSSSDGTPENVEPKSYTTRTDLDDKTVKIEIEGDKIKVTTDDDVAYAVPAKCNVDIILTVPTNSAALNQNNNDKNTSTSGTPYISESTTPTDDAKETPICEITRAYQEFLKENFFYTRGVNVGVIPYSGKVSLRSDRSDWVKDPDEFVDDGNTNIVGAALYGTKGENGEKLTEIGSFAGGDVSYGLLCRGNTENYGSNKITKGDLLLSTENPTTSDIYKFRKMVYDPCYLTDANLLSMKCENGGNKYWMNPYFILEMNPNVKFIYNMLGAFYPYYDDRNVSNFIFIPVTWANNLLQSWSATGGNSAQNTSANSTTLGRLSTPSKGTKDDGRKKALILIVNKPDWFEPGELTYLGFDNDYSETLAVESDLIRFDKGKTSGAKGILEYDSSKGNLSFPRKGLLRIVVEPTDGTGTIKFTNVSESYPSATSETSVKKRSEFFITPDKINNTTDNNNYYVGITLKSTKLVSAEITNRPYKVESGKVVYTALTPPERSVFIDLLKQSSGGKFDYEISGADNSVTPSSHLVYGSDGDGTISNVGIKYQSPTYTPPAQTASDDPLPIDVYENPNKWETIKSIIEGITHGHSGWTSICYGGEKYVAVSRENGYAVYSKDGMNWNLVHLPSEASWQSVCYVNDFDILNGIKYSHYVNGFVNVDGEKTLWSGFVAVANNGNISAVSEDGISWTEVEFPSNETSVGLTVVGCFETVLGGDYIITLGDGKGFYLTAIYDSTGKWDSYKWIKLDDVPKDKTWSSILYQPGWSGSESSKCFAFGDNNYYTIVGGSGSGLLKVTGGTSFSDKKNKWISASGNIVVAKGSEYAARHNGTQWETVNIGKKDWYSVCNDGESYVAVADDGTIAYTYDSFSNKNDVTVSYDNNKISKWRSVCYGNNGFVAISEKGYFARKKVGYTWENGTIFPKPILKSVCYGNGTFVAAVANSDKIMYSSDGESWKKSNMPTLAKWSCVCYGDGKFFAVAEGNSNISAYSEDGKNWTEVKLPYKADWKSVCFDNYRKSFKAFGSNGACSTFGDNKWTQDTSEGQYSWQSVCYGNVGSLDGVVVVGDGKIFNDISGEMIDTKGKNWKSVCFGNGKFFAVGDKCAAYSTDGTNWTEVTGEFSSKSWKSVCYGNKKFVAVAENYVAYFDSSNNAVGTVELTGNWESICYCEELGRFVAVDASGKVAYCDVKVIPAKFVAVANGKKVAYSTNGIDWGETELPYLKNWRSVCYGNRKFVAVADGKIIYSTDVTAWKDGKGDDISKGNWSSVCYGNGKFVAVADGKIIYSTDGITWKNGSGGDISGKNWSSVCYGNGKFVAVASGSDWSIYSTDGVNWSATQGLPKDDYDWNSVCYGNGKFVAISYCKETNEVIRKAACSDNGIDWSETSLTGENNKNKYKWAAVCYGDGKFVAITTGSAKKDMGNDFSVSFDGNTWYECWDQWDEANYQSICYGDGKFVFVGKDTVVYGEGYGNNGEDWTTQNGKKENWTKVNLSGNWTSVCVVHGEEEPEVKPIERGWYFYNNDKSDSTNHHFIFPTNPGDMYFVTNSEEFTYKNGDIYPMEEANGFFIDVDNTYFEVNGGAVTKYLGSGLYRWTMPAEKAKGISISSNANARQFYWSVKNLGNVSLPTLYAGATLPINAALFTGGWQSKDGKWNGVDATAAVKEVTQDACTKLKTEWGDNLRIYLIKYRAQAGDYDYLNDCTSYKYDVSTKDDLNNTLSSIATDIKNWAGRTAAKNMY